MGKEMEEVKGEKEWEKEVGEKNGKGGGKEKEKK